MLNDLLADGLKLVVCGSAAGTKSAQVGHYYAGPGNRFWRTLADVGLTPRELAPAEYELLLRFGVGLTDLVKGQAGSDSAIRFGDDADSLRQRILRHQPRYLAFNGKRSAKEFFRVPRVEYGVHPATIGRTVLFVAPSTSGAARASWDLDQWRRLAELVAAGEKRAAPTP